MLSATLIVRNEEKFLPDCLDSLRGLADEIVVVDTGSTDDTRAVALDRGAKLHDFGWRDNFAAARNFALDQASGEWILYIDADERVRPYARATLHQELATPGLRAARLCFYPQTGLTAYRELRLFRRHPDIRFEGAIHETIVPSLKRLVDRDGGAMGYANLTIDHLGYDGGSVRKHARDLGMLLRQVRIDPDRAYLWWHLGSIHFEKGCLPEAERAWQAGIEAVRRSPRGLAEQSLCFVELARQRLVAGASTEALDLVGEVRALLGNNLLLDCLEARGLAALGRWHESLGIFERLAGIDADTLVGEFAYDRDIFGAGALAEAGLSLFRSGRYAESAGWYSRAVALAPERPDLRAKWQLALVRAR